MRYLHALLTGLAVSLGLSGQSVARGEEPAVAAARARAINQLKQLGIALNNHHDAYKTFPPPAISDAAGKPLLSWRVKILPLLEEGDLYNQFHLDEPWDSEHNKALIEQMPDVYACPLSKVAGEHRTVYVAPRGGATVFSEAKGTRMRSITDGTSKTIALLEVDDKQAVIWTKPDDWTLNLANPTAGLGGHFPGTFLATACDASVHIIPDTIEAETFRALLSRNGREDVSFPDN